MNKNVNNVRKNVNNVKICKGNINNINREEITDASNVNSLDGKKNGI